MAFSFYDPFVYPPFLSLKERKGGAKRKKMKSFAFHYLSFNYTSSSSKKKRYSGIPLKGYTPLGVYPLGYTLLKEWKSLQLFHSLSPFCSAGEQLWAVQELA